MKSNAIRKTGFALLLFLSLWLVGCTTPYEIVKLKPFPDTVAELEIIGPDDSDIQEALLIIDSVLTKNGYITQPAWTNGGNPTSNTSKGWFIEKTYIHEQLDVDAMVFNQGSKEPTTVLKAGKRSVEIYVDFREPMRWFLKAHPDVIRVRDEIAEELAKRFGSEKVTTENGRVGSELM